MIKTTILKNGSKDEAYRLFDETKSSITDFKKESIGISGNLRNHNEGWRVVKITY